MSLVLWLAPLAPLMLAALLALPGAAHCSGSRLIALSPAAAIPALVLAVFGGGETSEAPWVLLNVRLEVDPLGRVLLLLTAVVWLLASVYAHGYVAERRRRFALFWLVTMSGNVTLAVSGDAVTFYSGFVVMTFAAYGLIVHTDTQAARRAGRVYIVMAVLGEAALIAGLVAAVSSSAGEVELSEVRQGLVESPRRDLIIGLLLAGFGIKAGTVLLHMWLPLAHPEAPVPASAVLSGVMIKAGLLGWLRFLPLGLVSLEVWGWVMIVVGLVGAFFGVLLGLPHRDPKITLAYSSISQMGIIATILGVGLTGTASGQVATGALAVYALHHGLAKAALFLGVSIVPSVSGRSRIIVLTMLAIPALAVAGAPFTSGLVAKGVTSEVAHAAAGTPEALLTAILPWTSVATTVLLVRYFVLVERAEAAPPRSPEWPRVAWAATTLASALLIWVLPERLLAAVDASAYVYPGAVWDATWPIAVGLLVALGVMSLMRFTRLDVNVPPGDLVVLFERGAGASRRATEAFPTADVLRALSTTQSRMRRVAVALAVDGTIERRLTSWTVSGAMMLIVLALLALTLTW